MTTVDLAPGTACWSCKYPLQQTTGASTSRRPHHGDVSMCIACGELGRFVQTPEGLTVRELSPSERSNLLTDPGVVRALAERQVAADGDPEWPGRRPGETQ